MQMQPQNEMGTSLVGLTLTGDANRTGAGRHPGNAESIMMPGTLPCFLWVLALLAGAGTSTSSLAQTTYFAALASTQSFASPVTSLCNLGGDDLAPRWVAIDARLFSDGLETSYLFDPTCSSVHLPLYFHPPIRPNLPPSERRPSEIYRVLLLSGEPVDTRHRSISGHFEGLLECGRSGSAACMLRVERIGSLTVSSTLSSGDTIPN